jgi:hypothetical protein
MWLIVEVISFACTSGLDLFQSSGDLRPVVAVRR